VGSRALLIFDGDCGFCSSCARFIARRLPTDAEVKPWQRVNLAAYGVAPEQTQHEVVWVATDGRIDGGAQAVARLLLDCGGLWTVPGAVLRVPPFRWIGHGLYRLVANNRDRMPGGTAACKLPSV
jgi:predicted DCC family thiol-disulfide oxidoreductase YuxK